MTGRLAKRAVLSERAKIIHVGYRSRRVRQNWAAACGLFRRMSMMYWHSTPHIEAHSRGKHGISWWRTLQQEFPLQYSPENNPLSHYG